jgi:hypothetical protein
LVCVDVFSRYALVEPVPTKAAEQVRDAFENIFERNREIPQMIYSDSGREFMGKCGIMFASRKIYHKQDRSDMGGSIVERFNRTLRGKIERYITWVKSNDFLPVLQQLVQSYNNTIHPIHRRTPASVYKLSRAAQKSIYRDISQVDFTEWKKKDYTQQVIKFKFKIGDYVRIMAEKGVFKKATGMKRWSDVLYQVAQLCPTIPPTYKVVNDGELNDRSYYKEDMQKVNPPEKVNIQVKEPIQKLSLQKENVLSKHEKILRVKLPRAAKK